MSATEASGSRPSAARPPPIRIAPAAARAGADSTRRASGAAASAASGSAVTAAAAAIGVRRQPSISSRTTRNSAAASAAEISPSATFAARCGRPAARVEPAAPSPRADAGQRDRHAGGERHLEQEDRLPGDELGQQAADAWAERRPERARGGPDRRGPALGADPGGQQLERRADAGRAPRRLHAAGGEQEPRSSRRARRRGSRARTRSSRRPPPGPRPSAGRACAAGTAVDRQNEVEADQHPGDRGDRDVELAVDVGERENDDRRVGEHESRRRARAPASVPEPSRGARSSPRRARTGAARRRPQPSPGARWTRRRRRGSADRSAPRDPAAARMQVGAAEADLELVLARLELRRAEADVLTLVVELVARPRPPARRRPRARPRGAPSRRARPRSRRTARARRER